MHDAQGQEAVSEATFGDTCSHLPLSLAAMRRPLHTDHASDTANAMLHVVLQYSQSATLRNAVSMHVKSCQS